MPRFSGITPSGHAQLGNYLGAIRRWAAEHQDGDLYFVSDLHAMTTPYRPERLRRLTGENFAVLLAAGIDPDSLFVQSDLSGELGAMTWLLECTCGYGEAARMTQFKEKSRRGGHQPDSVSLGLLTYPVLMAADILLQGATEVPVGADQNQHVELARTLARRFNTTYGDVFAMPEAVTPRFGARIADLTEPSRKMAKSAQQSSGVVYVLDEPDLIRRKFSRAVTDGLGTVRYDPDAQPGVSNLLDILAACRNASPYAVVEEATSYAGLKERVCDAVIETLRPVRERAVELLGDPAELNRIRAKGAATAAGRARPRLEAAQRLAGVR